MNENTGGFYLKPKETSIDELRMYLGEEKKRKAKLLDNISPKGIEISGITEDPLVSYTGYTDFGDSVEDDYVDEFYLDDNEPLDF